MSRPAPTLIDVARRAGVSTATVSRCLNAPDRVIEKTRAKVMQAIQELGYSPNFGARVMAAKRTRTIGAIIPTMENAIFARGLQAFQEALYESGYTLLVASSSYDPLREEEQVRSLVARGADGLLLIGHERSAALRDFLRAQQVPSLVAWTFDRDASGPSVGFDNRSAMQALVSEVIAQGHRQIGYISARIEGNDRARQRLEGARAAIREAGLAPPICIETTYGIETGAAAFETLMQGETPPSVVICGNDVLAAGALQQAHAMGIPVPGQVSITGFDDIQLAQVVTPPLTTVHVPHREMGRRAADMLVEMVEDQSAGSAVELPVTLQLRESLTRV